MAMGAAITHNPNDPFYATGTARVASFLTSLKQKRKGLSKKRSSAAVLSHAGHGRRHSAETPGTIESKARLARSTKRHHKFRASVATSRDIMAAKEGEGWQELMGSVSPLVGKNLKAARSSLGFSHMQERPFSSSHHSPRNQNSQARVPF